jgi:glycine cleavage system H lipoate-binding protein
MTTHDFLSVYDAKVAEYLLAVTYLLLFVPMWRFVQGGAHAAAHVTAGARASQETARPARATLGWFTAPENVALHPGHAWARLDGDGLITVGIDDFAQKLVDPENVVLPKAGDHVLQGQPAFAIGDKVVTVPMLSPVDGEVVAVNAASDQAGALRDPYGAGWLFKVKAPPQASTRAPLMLGERARQYLERAAEALSLRMNPELGHVLQDGGVPIHGIARTLAGAGWVGMAKHFFLTDRSES